MFKQFIKLIEFDQSLLPIEKHLVQTQAVIEEFKNQLVVLTSEHEKESKLVYELRKQVDQEELVMRTYDQQEKAARIRLDAAASPKEFQALKKEHDLCKQNQYAHEEVLMAVWNAYEAKQKQAESLEQGFVEKKGELEKELLVEQEKLQELQNQIQRHMQDRVSYMHGVPEEWINKYSRMRSTIKNPVVGIVAGTCGGCSYLLSNQLLLGLGQNKLVQCTSCYRLLYKHFEPTDVVV